MLFLLQDFVKSYALFTETVILILNRYEQMIGNARIVIRKSNYMKKLIQKMLLIVLGIIIGIMICKSPWNNNWFDCIAKWASWQNWGSIAEWLGSIGTVGALGFAFKEINDSRKQFNEEHKSELIVYANWKRPENIKPNKDKVGGNAKFDNSKIYLHIIPVNKGLASGIYRYFGICKAENVNDVVSLVRKAENNNLDSKDNEKLLNLICYDPEDVGQTDEDHDTNITSLLYPDVQDRFQTLKPNSVGEILNKNKNKIEKKLNADIFKNKLAVLYIDPQMKVYSFEVGLYHR